LCCCQDRCFCLTALRRSKACILNRTRADGHETVPSLSEPLYPVTIFRTRYGGIYEGGEWAAFPLDLLQVPDEPIADDLTCATWWKQFADAVGVGDTPDAALADLEAKSAATGVRIPYQRRPGPDL
jgi:hypothetical protein